MTSKKTKFLVVGITLAIVLFFILQVQFHIFGNALPFALGTQGTSTLSLSQANLQSSSSYFSGKAWLLTFAQGTLAQKYTGTFSPSDVQQATSDSSTTTNSFSVDVSYEPQKCDYSIYRTTLETPIYDIQYKTFTCILGAVLSESNFRSGTGLSNLIYYGQYSLTTKCWAVGYNTQSPTGSLASPNKESQYTITVTTPSGTNSKTINTLSGSGQGAIGNNVYAVWLGNLERGISCPDKDPYVPVYINGIWKLGSSSAYRDYLNILPSLNGVNEQQKLIQISEIQNAIARAKQSQSFGTLQSSTSLTNAVVKVEVADPLQFPLTTLYIKASEIGIYTPSPELEISSASSECFKTGDTGSISVNFKNVGSEYGTWNVYAQCEGPFTSAQSIIVGLQPGQTSTRLIPLSASASQKMTGSCTIIAESPAGIKEASVNTCVDPQITCTANEKFCGVVGAKEVIKQCSSDGATSSVIDTCDTGFVCDKSGGNIQCKLAETQGGAGFFDKIANFFKNLFNGVFDFFMIIRIVFSIVVGVFTLLFSKDFIMNFRALEGKEAVAWIIALVLGGLLGYLAFTIFWVGIVGLAIFIILKLVLPKRR